MNAEEIALMIKPNYGKVRSAYIKMTLVFVIIILLLEIIMFIIHYEKGIIEESPVFYAVKNIVIPSILNFLFLGAAKRINDKKTENEKAQIIAPIFASTAICTVVAIVHSSYEDTLALFCIPVFMAAIYGAKPLNKITMSMNTIGLTIAWICRAVHGTRAELLPEIIIAYAVLFTAGFVAGSFAQLLAVQKDRLVESTRSAYELGQRAQAANQAKSEFLANMSHEIRTPLNAVIGMTEIIIRKSHEPEIQQYAGDIQRSGNLLLSIINDILDISKIESGKIEIQESKYELGSLINDSYNMVASRGREKGLVVTVTCDPNLPRLLYGDEYHMRQVLVNLLSNAVKYTHKGEVELNVMGEEDNDILRMDVKVRDTGIGIKAEDIPKLFGKFNRMDLAKNRQIEGTGLGLSITKQLVELMEGSINVESVYGLGSIFTVRIPQKIVDKTPIGDIKETYLDIHGSLEEYHQSFEAPDACILVVDDVAVNLQVICKLLEATRIEVHTAGSGREALNMVCGNKYDLILMDHMMPEMDGIETLQIMREDDDFVKDNIPVIMLTANAMVGAREEYLAKGFTDYITKPVKGVRLEKMLMKYLPKNKIKLGGNAVKEEKKEFSCEQLKEKLPEIDTETGIMYCAGEEFYRSILGDFREGEDDVKLESAFNSEDWKNYQIYAHSLKNTSKMVGLTDLSEECLKLEYAARDSDIEYIRDNHKKTAEHYKNVAEILKTIEL